MRDERGEMGKASSLTTTLCSRTEDELSVTGRRYWGEDGREDTLHRNENPAAVDQGAPRLREKDKWGRKTRANPAERKAVEAGKKNFEKRTLLRKRK